MFCLWLPRSKDTHLMCKAPCGPWIRCRPRTLALHPELCWNPFGIARGHFWADQRTDFEDLGVSLSSSYTLSPSCEWFHELMDSRNEDYMWRSTILPSYAEGFKSWKTKACYFIVNNVTRVKGNHKFFSDMKVILTITVANTNIAYYVLSWGKWPLSNLQVWLLNGYFNKLCIHLQSISHANSCTWITGWKCWLLGPVWWL